jgi:hypothetical protein
LIVLWGLQIILTMRNITIEMTFEIPEGVNAAMLYEHLFDASMSYNEDIVVLESTYDCTEEEREEVDRLMFA